MGRNPNRDIEESATGLQDIHVKKTSSKLIKKVNISTLAMGPSGVDCR